MMLPCINEATTMTSDFITDMHAYAQAGFGAVELWLEKLERYLEAGNSIESAQQLLSRLALTPVAACAEGGHLVSSGMERQSGLERVRRRLALCQALSVPVLIVYSESAQAVSEATYDLAARNLAEVCDIAGEYGVRMALEFIKCSPLVGTLTTAQMLIARARRSNLGLLLDTFHFYAGISKMEDLEGLRPNEVAFVHINDALDRPREIWSDADRVLIGEGVLPLSEIMGMIRASGYDGYVSLELFNRALWEEDPFLVARRAYASVSDFLSSLK
jgi:sugar phosphate isomerase/epimerase